VVDRNSNKASLGPIAPYLNPIFRGTSWIGDKRCVQRKLKVVMVPV
jgi:hypothetical protein